MNILAVDDERRALHTLERAITSVAPGAAVFCCTSAKEALCFAAEQRVDTAFLDITMPEMSGLLLAKHLKEIYGDTNIIFVTAYSQYMGDAFGLRASGYVLKPINPERVREELDNLRNPVVGPDKGGTGVHVQCFGNFAVFANGRPLPFARKKTKELFAYLVYRQGAYCGVNEIAATLWEGESDSSALQSYLRQLVADLAKTLQAAGIPATLLRRRGALAILPETFTCDFYDFCAGKNSNAYKGEFMAQYSWAEFADAFLR